MIERGEPCTAQAKYFFNHLIRDRGSFFLPHSDETKGLCGASCSKTQAQNDELRGEREAQSKQATNEMLVRYVKVTISERNDTYKRPGQRYLKKRLGTNVNV